MSIASARQDSDKPNKRHRPSLIVLNVVGLCLVVLLRHNALRDNWRRYVGAMPPQATHSASAAKILAGAKAQKGTAYNAKYRIIPYPNGDVPKWEGACTDVVIRALRADGIDLQKLVHEDMVNHFASYPQEWHLREPDPNIDHRRVPNLMHFMSRHAQVLTTTVSPLTLAQWQPGDIVCWNTGRRTHTGIVSDTRNAYGEPFVIDNGFICVEEDALMRWKIIGHYRYPVAKEVHHRGR